MRSIAWALVTVAGLLVAPVGLASGTDQGAEVFDGPWTGEIRVAGITLQMRVVFTTAAEGLSATIDIPQQGAAGLVLGHVRRDGDRIHFELTASPAVASFDGLRTGDRIEGTFAQAGATGTFLLVRGNEPPAPEAPAADVPYEAEEVTFGHGDVRLAGTVTTPRGAGPFPAVVLISGSGAQTRDEDVNGFKVFATLADALTRAGIAVLRYDDRGVGRSTGPMDVTTPDYAADVLAAVGLLKARPAVRPGGIGLVGHSEGALVAALTATRSADVAFVVLMAGTTVPGDQIVRAQAEAILRANGGSEEQVAAILAQQNQVFAAVRTGEGWDDIEARTRAQGQAQIAALTEAQRQALGDRERYLDGVITRQLAAARSAWFRFFIDYDPAVALREVAVPVLAVFGGRDLQVLVDQNRPVLESVFAGERAGLLTVRTYDAANHLFQEARTGLPTEYAVLPKAFVAGFADEVAEWILSRSR